MASMSAFPRPAALALSLLAMGPSFAHAAPDDTPLRAVAEDGRRVLLLPNGSWRVDTQPSATGRADTLASPYRTAVKRFTVKYDTAQWFQQPLKEGEENKRSFKHRSLPLQAMVIADEFPASTAALHNLVLHNARSIGATVTVLLDEEREVSSQKVGYLRFLASTQGMDFIFATNYFGSAEGNIQVTCFTAQSLFAKVQAECQQFINGLTIQ